LISLLLYEAMYTLKVYAFLAYVTFVP
jgi:hypothetical protein